jgi:hypothetical protein
MCLYVDEKTTEEIRAQLKEKGFIKAWKVCKRVPIKDADGEYVLDDKGSRVYKLTSPYNTQNEIHPGINKSDRSTQEYPSKIDRDRSYLLNEEFHEDITDISISRGIHVATKIYLAVAIGYLLSEDCGLHPDERLAFIVIPVICYEKDFVAAGERLDAVFMEVTVEEEVYESYLTKGQKLFSWQKPAKDKIFMIEIEKAVLSAVERIVDPLERHIVQSCKQYTRLEIGETIYQLYQKGYLRMVEDNHDHEWAYAMTRSGEKYYQEIKEECPG